jgi:hypothetical protein
VSEPFFQDKNLDDRDAMPDEWEALELLTKQSFSLLPIPLAGAPYDWESDGPK